MNAFLRRHRYVDERPHPTLREAATAAVLALVTVGALFIIFGPSVA